MATNQLITSNAADASKLFLGCPVVLLHPAGMRGVCGGVQRQRFPACQGLGGRGGQGGAGGGGLGLCVSEFRGQESSGGGPPGSVCVGGPLPSVSQGLGLGRGRGGGGGPVLP